MYLTRYLKCFVKVSILPSGRIIACVSCALSYCLSLRFRLVNSLSYGGLVMSGSDEVESAGGGGGVGCLKNPGWGKKTASVLMLLKGFRRAYVGQTCRIGLGSLMIRVRVLSETGRRKRHRQRKV